ncbi:MAG: S1 RNA-binding domain-containing protein [Nanohaloarchaea archaeon]|nr:S1 RNA-binding domain-containing protein [Candidatus Nanohaloarchaea archaeon]
MKWYKDRPDVGDFVVITITDVDKNSAYADLDEYEDVTGLIHISEVSRSWVQDIRKEVDEGEKTVAQVVEDDDGTLDLSLKRVNDSQKRNAMSRWKKEQKAEKFIEDLAEKIGEDKEEMYERVVFPLQREFGSAFHGFEIAVGEEEKLEEMFDSEVVDGIQEVARNNINLRQEKLEGEIELSFTEGDGVAKIKEVFEDVGDGVEVKYVSAPKYSITAWGRNQELAKNRMDSAVKQFRQKADELDGEFEFSKA